MTGRKGNPVCMGYWQQEKIMLFVIWVTERIVRRGQNFPGRCKTGDYKISMPLISDGGPGLKEAIDDCFSGGMRQRCVAHKLRNISDKLNKKKVNKEITINKGCLLPDRQRNIAKMMISIK